VREGERCGQLSPKKKHFSPFRPPLCPTLFLLYSNNEEKEYDGGKQRPTERMKPLIDGKRKRRRQKNEYMWKKGRWGERG
jgi:hypothetical protein